MRSSDTCHVDQGIDMTTHHRGLRPALLATSALLISGLLAACGSNAEDDTDRADSSHLLPAAEGTTEYPLTIDAGWGEVTLEERPERLLAADSYEFGLLVALGVTPVASHDVDLDQVPWSSDVLVEDPETWEWGGDPVPPEVVAKVDADLVVATAWGPTPFDNLAKIEQAAPVLSQPEPDATGVSWQDQITLLGEALDLQDRAAAVIDDYDEQMAEITATHPELAGKTVAFLEFWAADEVYYSNPPGGSIQVMLEDMGLAPNPAGEQYTKDALISGELIGDVSADIVVVMDYLGEQEALDGLLDAPLFQSIPAVQEGQLLVLRSIDRVTLEHDGQQIGRLGIPMAYNDPLGTPKLAETLAPLLSQTLQG